MSGDPVAFSNTSAVDICSCVYLIIYQALHSPTFRPHAHVIFEFKNYKDVITQKEIYTTEKYLYAKALRCVAIIVSCNGSDENAKKAIKGTLRENGKLILNLSNRDLSNMLEYELNGNLASEYLYNVLDEMLIELEK